MIGQRVFFLWIGIVLVATAISAHADVRFRHLTALQGLSSDEIFSILQDRQGYIWFATANGLDRYDGYTVKIFRHESGKPGTVSANLIRALYEDPKGRLWVGTFGGGLDLYEPVTGTFRHYRHIAGDPNTLASNNIWSLNSTPDGKLLVGTFDAGLDVFDVELGKIHHFPAMAQSNGPSDNRINAIYTGPSGLIFIATNSALDEFNFKKGTFRHLGNLASKNAIWSIAARQTGLLWLATNKGIQTYQSGQRQISSPLPIESLPPEMQEDHLRSILRDTHGNLWVGGAYTGLYLFSADGKPVRHFQQIPSNPDSLSSDIVWDIYQDRSGVIWFATDNGVNILDSNALNTEYIKPLSITDGILSASNKVFSALECQNALLLGSTAGIYRIPVGFQYKNATGSSLLFQTRDAKRYGPVTALHCQKNGNLFAGTGLGYVFRFNSHGGIQRIWKVGPNTGSNQYPIFSIIPDAHANLYLGSFGGGILKFNTETSVTTRIGTDSAIPTTLFIKDHIESMLLQPPETLWIGTYRGLFNLNLANGQNVLVSLNQNGNEPDVESLYAYTDGVLLVGTSAGLWQLRPTLKKMQWQIKHFPILQNNTIWGIEPDAQGNLWLAGDTALVRFNPHTDKTLIYDSDRGLPVTSFYANAHTRTSNGWLWFGGGQGLVGFNPNKIKPPPAPPALLITNIIVQNNGRLMHLRPDLDQPLNLNYRDSVITINMAVADFNSPGTNTYSYRLLGLQSEWSPSTTSHQITFTNLTPGHYHLEVRGANNWDIWSKEPATLNIIVLPPWWRTWWAYSIYTLLILMLMAGLIYSQKRKVARERKISNGLREADEIKTGFLSKLEEQVQQATRELRGTLETVNLKNVELEVAHKRASAGEQIKSQFLANMSHELRTPLTAILGYLKLLAHTRLSAEQEDYLRTVRHSSESLLAIINDTLDISRLEAGKLLIDEVDFDLLDVIESTVELLAPTAYQKQLELLRIVPPEVSLRLRGDPLRVRQVLTNLVGNAIKFTERGSVCIRVHAVQRNEREARLAIAVSDTGTGIPQEILAKLFEAYMRNEQPAQPHIEGTGLGLAICKRLVSLMGGDINVFSTPSVGSTFEFQLPFNLQKAFASPPHLTRPAKVLLLDPHPLSSQAWSASLARFGAEVTVTRVPETVGRSGADALIIALSPEELAQHQALAGALIANSLPRLVLAPTVERRMLEQFARDFRCRALSKSAREETVFMELRSVLRALPTAEPAPGKSARVLVPQDAPLILIADDNAINRKLLATLLRQNGWRVAEAASGEEFLALANKNAWAAALLDIHMPDLNGIATLARLREQYPGTLPPVIAVSADASADTRAQALSSGMRDYLVKPYTEEQLLEVLRKHLPKNTNKPA